MTKRKQSRERKEEGKLNDLKKKERREGKEIEKNAYSERER